MDKSACIPLKGSRNLEAIVSTYAAMAPKLVALTVLANAALSIDTRRIRTTMMASRTALPDTNVSAKTGSNCTKQRQIATIANSAVLSFFSENFVNSLYFACCSCPNWSLLNTSRGAQGLWGLYISECKAQTAVPCNVSVEPAPGSYDR